ncbi:hypothetical protein [Solimonas soli]|uniref:DUF7931 domain-containing protein n=1 Tax=Solimonas soli TaxID=413479 RepID=UPI000485D634|nr:hypothetical protein [Solimonas soli]
MSDGDQPQCESDAGPAGASVLAGSAATTQALLNLITRAHLQLRVLSYELDRRLWNDPGIVELLRSFVLRSPRAELRILVNRPQLAAQRGHRLVELARRLSSRIHIRELGEERRNLVEEFAIADEYALLHKKRHDDLETWWYPHAPLDARQQRRRFDAWWEESGPARELGELRL